MPDVATVIVAIIVLLVWTGAAMFVGALISRRHEAERLDLALQLRSLGEAERCPDHVTLRFNGDEAWADVADLFDEMEQPR